MKRGYVRLGKGLPTEEDQMDVLFKCGIPEDYQYVVSFDRNPKVPKGAKVLSEGYPALGTLIEKFLRPDQNGTVVVSHLQILGRTDGDILRNISAINAKNTAVHIGSERRDVFVSPDEAAKIEALGNEAKQALANVRGERLKGSKRKSAGEPPILNSLSEEQLKNLFWNYWANEDVSAHEALHQANSMLPKKENRTIKSVRTLSRKFGTKPDAIKLKKDRDAGKVMEIAMHHQEIDSDDFNVLVLANNRNFLGWPENQDHSSALYRLKENGLVEVTEFGSVIPSDAGYTLLKAKLD